MLSEHVAAFFPTKSAARTDKSAIVALGWNEWSDYWMPRQQYLFRLSARGWPVVYSAGAPSVWQLRSREGRRALGFRSSFDRRSNVNVYRPGKLLPRWPTRPVMDRMAIWNEVRNLKKARTKSTHRPILFVTHPDFAPYLHHFDDYRIVYFIEDAVSLMPDWTAADAKREEAVVRRADMIVTCAESMAKVLPGDGSRRARILRNGVDFRAFNRPESHNCPADLAAVPHPRIGYTGSVNLKVDFGMVASVAAQRPDWHWVFVGPTGLGPDRNFNAYPDVARGFAACQALPNVHFLGCKPFHALPSYVGNMDINAMCYRTDGSGWWKAIDPLKTNEYLAAGKPIVSADLVNVRPYVDCIDIAQTEQDWMAAIERALASDTSERVRLGVERAKCNDWAILTDELESWLRELIA